MKKNLKRLAVLIMSALLLAGSIGRVEPAAAKAKSTKPAKPEVALQRDIDGKSITVTIDKTARTDGYKILMKEDGTSAYKKVKTLKKSGTEARTYTIKNLDPAKTYQIKVRAYNTTDGKKVWGKYSEVTTVTPEVSTGDIITFGSYEQDASYENGYEPLEWIVLKKDGDKLFLVSVYALEADVIDQDEDDERFDGSWKHSEMRAYLNNSFITKAFTDKEAAAILQTELEDVGTTDRVFLLSYNEVKNAELGFERVEDRRCAPTAHAVFWEDDESESEECVWIWDDDEFGDVYYANDEIACFWWLRTPCTDKSGNPNGEFYMVRDSGKITSNYFWGDELDSFRSDYDEDFYVDGFGTRPAMVISLDKAKKLIKLTGRTMKSDWSKARTVEAWEDDEDDDW